MFTFFYSFLIYNIFFFVLFLQVISVFCLLFLYIPFISIDPPLILMKKLHLLLLFSSTVVMIFDRCIEKKRMRVLSYYIMISKAYEHHLVEIHTHTNRVKKTRETNRKNSNGINCSRNTTIVNKKKTKRQTRECTNNHNKDFLFLVYLHTFFPAFLSLKTRKKHTVPAILLAKLIKEYI